MEVDRKSWGKSETRFRGKTLMPDGAFVVRE